MICSLLHGQLQRAQLYIVLLASPTLCDGIEHTVIRPGRWTGEDAAVLLDVWSPYLIRSHVSWNVQFMGKKIDLSSTRGSWYFLG